VQPSKQSHNLNMCDNIVISKRINEQFEKLYHVNDDGVPVPYVCLICDRFLKFQEVKILDIALLEKMLIY
jgi:hypothetical protein